MDIHNLNLIATSSFGLEGIIAAELKRIGMQNVQPDNGFVRFKGNVTDAFTVNIRTRFADRIMIVLAENQVSSFEELFQTVKRIDWQDLCKGNEKINISCKCARSRLMSPRDCQSISKKAVISKLSEKTGRNIFPENGSALPIHIHIHQDLARIALDTSGEGLSRRGYRTWNGEAPLRESLAAALVELSPWRPGMPLYDPCCGTGTILIEAAMRAAHKAPGINRSFAMEMFSFVDPKVLSALREEIRIESDTNRMMDISGSDINPEAIGLANRHIKQAGFYERIQLCVKALQDVNLDQENGVFICNPPYGERLSDKKACAELYRELHKLKDRHPGWKLCAISSDPSFERSFGKKADRKRRLYNGTLECNYYTYL